MNKENGLRAVRAAIDAIVAAQGVNVWYTDFDVLHWAIGHYLYHGRALEHDYGAKARWALDEIERFVRGESSALDRFTH